MPLWNLWGLSLVLIVTACAPKIGNKCTLSTECSQLGDRLCDTTQPGGYCTIFNCEPDTCPSAICVAFDPSLDPACKGADDGRSPRFQRSFCMGPCSTHEDCRTGYECVDLSVADNQASRRAQVVDTGAAAAGGLGFRVCMAATCFDGIQNGDETDIDCGGACSPCKSGRGCRLSTDCCATDQGCIPDAGPTVAGTCSQNRCQGPCTNGLQDGDESDIDCGGSSCPSCALGQVCGTDTDCASGRCLSGHCIETPIPAVCKPYPGVDGGVPWTPYTPDGGP